jgi:hypothetical protein
MTLLLTRGTGGAGPVSARPVGGDQGHLPVLSAGAVTLRHIMQGTGTGAVTVLGATFMAQRRAGVNGLRGFQSGRCERAINDEGTATLTLPNAAGSDGMLHRRRFAILTDPTYHPGDEWLEIEHDGLLFAGTPTDYDLTRSTLTLELADALWMQNTQRETAAGFWNHAPRDVFEHYSRAWTTICAADFATGVGTSDWLNHRLPNGGGDIPSPVGAGPVRLQLLDPFSNQLLSNDVMGGIAHATQRTWRLEMTYDRHLLNATTKITLAFGRVQLLVSATTIQTVLDDGSSLDVASQLTTIQATKSGCSLAIEGRDRWVLLYVDGALVGSYEYDFAEVATTYRPEIAFSGDSTAAYVDVHQVLLRRLDPYLMRGADKGDYHLPGLLPSGGLIGSYYNEADLRLLFGQAYYRRTLAPTRQPYQRRQDTTINFAATDPATWQPSGPDAPTDGKYFSVRWTGSIYLDLEAADVTMRMSGFGSSNHEAVLFIGKTMFGQEIAGASGLLSVTSGSIRAHLGSSVSGWYPIRIDYTQSYAAAGIVLERSIGGAPYEVVSSAELSPLGIYEAQVRYDSHAEQLKAVALAYGLQYACDPRTLESGEFPGTVIPRVRVGRDTDKVLTPDESTEASVKGSASEVIDTLYADAAGLGDQANSAQLTAEAVNYDALMPGTRMMVQSAYESLSDITDPVLLQTRLASMLGLRITPWQEVAARPRGHRELRSSFPVALTADLALFAWEPGDGIRIVDEALDIEDETPRQMISVGWPLVPDGVGAPSVRFRQRPRAQQDALRALVRAALLPQRNYQGQLTVVSGTTSVLDSGYSRVTLPRDLASVTRCELIVTSKSDTSTWTINDYPAGTALSAFATTGRFDLMPYLSSFDGTSPLMIIIAAGGTGTATYQLELVVRI